MFELNFKKFMESIGAGSMLPTNWTGSEADPTLAMMGHPPFLPGLDIAIGNGTDSVPQVKKDGLVKHFGFRQNPVVIELDDGTKLLMTLDQYKRITGDLPIIPKYTKISVIFQRNPYDMSNDASQITSCTSKFVGPDYLRKHYKVGFTYKP